MKPVALITPKWVQRFLETARFFASWSKDTTKVGAIATRGRHVVETGYNGLPMGVDELPNRLLRPAKYKWTCHAEQNLIAHAARPRLEGTTVTCTHLSCCVCAGMLINAGVAEVVVGEDKTSTAMDPQDFEIAKTMFYEAGVRLVVIGENGEPTVHEPRPRE